MTRSGLFVQEARDLAEPRDVSFVKPRVVIHDHPRARSITSIAFDNVFGQVAMTVDPLAEYVQIKGFGDAEVLDKLLVDPRGGHMAITGWLPFKPGGTSFGSSSQYNVFSGSGNVFGSDVVVNEGSMIVSGRGGSIVSGSGMISNGGRSQLIINGREVDQDRKILLVMVIPPRMVLRLGGLYGLIGTGGSSDGVLTLDMEGSTDVYVKAARAMTVMHTGSGDIETGPIAGDLNLQITGSGDADIDSVGGNAQVLLTGSSDITIDRGVSTSGSFTLTGSGGIKHGGTITGDATAVLTGSGKIKLNRVTGRCTPHITGSGHITVNDQKYKAKSRW